MLGSLAREYLDVIERLRWGEFRDKQEQRWLEGQRGLLHRQLEQVSGERVTVRKARRWATRSR
jgi:hypothetical protein